MDKGTLAVMIPVLALMIPVAAIVFGGLTKVMRLRIEEAKLKLQGGNPSDMDQLGAEVAQLRRELDEVHERLDFTERLLSQNRDPARLRQPDAP